MRSVPTISRISSLVARLALIVACAGCNSDNTGPTSSSDTLVLTSALVKSLDSVAQVIVQANPGNAELKALVDSTILVLTAGVETRRLDVATDLTSAPLYFVGVHRAAVGPTASFSTWTLVGFDDPAHLTNLIEVSGFAQSAGTTPPSSVNSTIGNGTGIVNALLLQVASGGAITQWNANTGAVSFISDVPGASCPGFTPTAKATCALETMHVTFSANAAAGSGGASARHATLSANTAVPAIRLTFTP